MYGAAKIGLSVVAAVVGFVAFWYLVPRSVSFGMFEGDEGGIGFRLALSFAATLFGVVLGSFYRQLRQLQAAGKDTIDDVPAFLARMFRSIDMWLGLAGSPIVYALLLQSTNGMSLPGLLIVAIENGFCCLLILNQFLGRAEADTKKGDAPLVMTKPTPGASE